MNRLHLACFSLIASAFVLAGLLIVAAPGHLTQKAQAEMLVNKDTVTMMTTLTRPGEEALFVIDSVNERLLIYRTELAGARGKLELAGNVDLRRLFGAVQAGPAGGGGRVPR